ncbi:MAG: FtsX-like permease family protein [Bacteroidota bacterium]
MLIQIAWKNIWRNKLRSLVVILAVAIGLLSGAFLMSFSYGINQERSRNIIETKISHVQIHQPEFRLEQKANALIAEGGQATTDLLQRPEVKAVASRLLVSGMFSTTKGANGVQINGIDPEQEAHVTKLPERLTHGTYFEGNKRNPILIGESLAEKIGLQRVDEAGNVSYNLRKRVVLTFQIPGGETQAAQFRIVGTFKSLNSKVDETQVYVKRSDLAALMGTGEKVHEIALILEDQEISEDSTFLQSVQATHPDLMVENWKDLAPDLKLVDESFAVSLTIFMSIIMLALLFGIVNTMFMAILERTRELGMLMSIGMNRIQVFLMIMLETIFLTLVGAPIGILTALGLISYFGNVGIDISAFAEGGAAMGVASTAYTYLEPSAYVLITIMVFITALIASIFPARRALKLNPAEAVRAI